MVVPATDCTERAGASTGKTQVTYNWREEAVGCINKMLIAAAEERVKMQDPENDEPISMAGKCVFAYHP